jgi:hypothetical protein
MYELFFYASYRIFLRTVLSQDRKEEDAKISAIGITSTIMLLHILSFIRLVSWVLDKIGINFVFEENKISVFIIIIILIIFNFFKYAKNLNNLKIKFESKFEKMNKLNVIIPIFMWISSAVLFYLIAKYFKNGF